MPAIPLTPPIKAVAAHCAQMIARLGKEIDNTESLYYWAYRNNIPVFCPALTDGSIGDMLYFHSYKRDGLVLDIVADIRAMNDEAISAKPRKTGMLVLGGGDTPDQHGLGVNAYAVADFLVPDHELLLIKRNCILRRRAAKASHCECESDAKRSRLCSLPQHSSGTILLTTVSGSCCFPRVLGPCGTQMLGTPHYAGV